MNQAKQAYLTPIEFPLTTGTNSTPTPPNSTPTPPNPTPTPPPSNVSLQVSYKVGDPGAPNDNQIKPFLQIINTSNTTINLSDITIRYWYTIDSNQPETYNCDYAVVSCGNIQGTFHATSGRTNADTYLELAFTAGAGTLAPNASSGEIQNRVTKNDWSNYNESNDYSYNGSQTSYGSWTRVTAYYKGQLAWGTEP